jgi:acetate---CoA ligase (ADP-forming)
LAVLGASSDPTKWGHALARNALEGAHRRSVFLVNRRGEEILGQPSYRSLADLPQAPELVAIVVRAAGFEAAVDESLRAGARAIVAITSGLGEKDPAGLALQRSVANRVRAAGAVLVGPNCLGIADTGTTLNLTWDRFRPGPIGLISQSGNLGLELAQLAQAASLGFSRFISVGNQADVDATECLRALIDHGPTRAIAIYLEDFGDGRAFASSAESAAAAGKPVVLLTIGTTAASARVAQSHTGALVSDSIAVDAACRASGMYRVETPLQMIDLLQVLLSPHRPSGRRIAIAGDGGGHVALATDRLIARGLVVERFSDHLAESLATILPPTATTSNPVDIAGAGEEDIFNFDRVVRLIAQSGEADGVVVTGYFGGYSEQSEDYRRSEREVAGAMARSAHDAGRFLMVHTMYPRSPTSHHLRQLSVPLFFDIDAAARALGRLGERMLNPPLGVPAPLLSPTASATLPADYFGTRQLLAAAGVPFGEARPVESEEAAIAAASAIGYPVVLKALSATHKSDAGGVRLAIDGEAQLSDAFREMHARLHATSFSVEKEVPLRSNLELLIGVKRDRSFGPIALVGLGGIYAEVFHDLAVALAPVSVGQGVSLIRSLRGAELMVGSRGGRPLDVDAAAGALSALSQLAAARPEIAEIEVNPLLVLERGVLGLDARLVRQSTDP